MNSTKLAVMDKAMIDADKTTRQSINSGSGLEVNPTDFALDDLDDFENSFSLEERPVARAAVRVSLVRGKDEDKRLSAKSQIEAGKRYCLFKQFDLDLEASLAHQDEGVSGFRKSWRDRPGIKEHYEAAKRREFQHLVFFKLSRLGRNVRDALEMIDAFDKEGVTIHTVSEQIDCSTPTGRFLRTVLLAAAEMQSEDTAEFIRAAIRTRALDKKVQHGMLPVWLRRGEEEEETDGDSHYIVIREQEAALRRMVELRMAGLGYVRIAKAMNSEGYRTVNGVHWTDGMVFKYLSPSWIDTLRGTGYLNRDLPEGHSDRIAIPNLFPPILSHAEADALRAVQAHYTASPMTSPIAGGGTWRENKAKAGERIQGGKRRPKQGRVSADSSFLLSSVVWCACCGEKLYSYYSSKSENRITPCKYICLHARTNAEAHIDGGVSISGWALEDAVLRVVRKSLQEPPLPVEKPKPRVAIKPATPTLEQIDKSIDRLVAMLDAERISEDDYDRRYAALRAQKEAIIAQREEETAPAARDTALNLMAQAGSADSPEGTGITRAQLRQLILLTVKRVEAPLVFEGRYVRGKNTGLRRYARVTLHFETADGQREFLVPLHKSNYTGIKDEPEPAATFNGVPAINKQPAVQEVTIPGTTAEQEGEERKYE